VDLFYDTDAGPEPPGGRRDGERAALALEMEAAALFALGARAEVPVACVLAVSDIFDDSGARERIDERSLLEAAERMGAAAVAALCV
jgi:nucleoside phosphorylase